MKIILGPVIDKINQLCVHGISFQSPGGPKVARAKLLMAVFDLPAKAMATKFVGIMVVIIVLIKVSTNHIVIYFCPPKSTGLGLILLLTAMLTKRQG